MRIDKFLPDLIMESTIPSDFVAWNRFIEQMLQKKMANGTLASTLILDKEWVKFNDINASKLIKFFAQDIRISHLMGYDDRLKKYDSLHFLAESMLQDYPTFYIILCLNRYLNSSTRKYYFHKEFFDDLKQTNLDKIRVNDLIIGSGVVRLPYDLDDSLDGSFNEFLFFVGPAREFFNLHQDNPLAKTAWEKMKDNTENLKDNSIQWAISWKGNDTSWNYTALHTTDSNTLIKDMYKNSEMQLITSKKGVVKKVTTVQEDGYRDHLKPLFNCLVYLKTGEPDLRAFKNEIRYRGSGGSTPVNKDRNLCQDDITMVGYSFKKLPNYSKMMFYQPPYYARRGLSKAWTWCKGSLKHRSMKQH